MLVTFIIFNTINVILQTIKSIATIKCNKYIASLVNAIAYGLYTYILVLTNCDLDLWSKILTVAFANLIGVFIVKTFEEKSKKDKIWKIEFSVTSDNTKSVDELLKLAKVSHNYVNVGDYVTFNAYTLTQKESESVKEIIKKYNAKYFVTEQNGIL